MQPIISGREGDRIKIEVTIDLSGSMLEAEESILRGVNAVGDAATAEALKRFDADGDPIAIGDAKWYSKGNYRRLTTRRTGSFRWSGMFISVPRAAKRFARWMMGQGLSEKRRLGSRRSCRINLRTSPPAACAAGRLVRLKHGAVAGASPNVRMVVVTCRE